MPAPDINLVTELYRVETINLRDENKFSVGLRSTTTGDWMFFKVDRERLKSINIGDFYVGEFSRASL